jgi:hypothetical protein
MLGIHQVVLSKDVRRWGSKLYAGFSKAEDDEVEVCAAALLKNGYGS